jgi:hypothetical protein
MVFSCVKRVRIERWRKEICCQLAIGCQILLKGQLLSNSFDSYTMKSLIHTLTFVQRIVEPDGKNPTAALGAGADPNLNTKLDMIPRLNDNSCSESESIFYSQHL